MRRIGDIAGAVALTVVLLAGCAGRAARPVMVYQPADATRSCDALDRELELIEEDITELIPQTDKADKNTALGVTGIFLLVPFFFMDLSKAEQIEVGALIKRYNHLLAIGDANGCGFEREPLQEFEKKEY